MNKRNPCRISKVEYKSDGTHIVERRGYAQERRTFDGEQMVFVMEGGDSEVQDLTKEMEKKFWSDLQERLDEVKQHPLP